MDDTNIDPFGNRQLDVFTPEASIGEEAVQFSAAKQKAIWEKAAWGISENSREAQKLLSLTGKELPIGWPRIPTPDEERSAYDCIVRSGR